VLPLGVNDTFSSVAGNGTNMLDVLANDGGSGTKTLASVSTPLHGTASISNGKISYTPTAGYSGSDSFTYTYTADGGTSQSVTASLTVLNTPGAPSLTSAVPGKDQMELEWSAPGSTGGSAISDYVIQRSTDGSTWSTVADGTSTATSYTVTGLTNNTAYRFRVSAVNGQGTGTPSEVLTATPTRVPRAPMGLAVTGGNLSWHAHHRAWSSPTDRLYVAYKKTADVDNPRVRWAVFAYNSGVTGRRASAMGIGLSAGRNARSCSARNEATGWEQCFTPYGMEPGTSYTFRVYARSADGTLGVMSPGVTYTP
jgi:Fibronectin type III domain/Bacterial Ig domain